MRSRLNKDVARSIHPETPIELMKFTIPPIIAYIVSWFGMINGVWALFDRAEKVAAPEVKERISTWLLTAQVPAKDNWPSTYTNLLDYLFGKKLLSLRSFLVSTLFSFLLVFLLSLVWYFLRPEGVENLLQQNSYRSDLGKLLFFLFFFLIFGGMLNVLQDYLSLIQTRYLLRRMAHNATLARQFSILFLDFVLTSALVWITFAIYLTSIWSSIETFGPTELLFRSLKFLPASTYKNDISLGMFVYSTYFSSVWMWLYVFSGIMARFIYSLNWSLKVVRRFLNLRENPLQSLGFISMLLITIIYLIVPFIGNL